MAQSLRPYPQFGGLGVSWAPRGNGWYDALQAKLTKRTSYGLAATAAYTRSKTLDTDNNFSFTFTQAGDYKYFCSLHPHMTGTIKVE